MMPATADPEIRITSPALAQFVTFDRSRVGRAVTAWAYYHEARRLRQAEVERWPQLGQ